MKSWNIIDPLGAGAEGYVYNVINKENQSKGALKVIDDNELGTTMALISLSKLYPYYVRVLDHEYLKTNHLEEGRAWSQWEEGGDFKSVIGQSTNSCDYRCHCVYELLEYPEEEWFNSYKFRIIIAHMLIAAYIAKVELGYGVTDLQWMYRKVTDNEDVIITYKEHVWALPNIGFMPVIIDHGNADIGDVKKERMLYNLLNKYYAQLYIYWTNNYSHDAFQYAFEQIPEEVKDLYYDEQKRIGYRYTPSAMLLKYIGIFLQHLLLSKAITIIEITDPTTLPQRKK